jgi:hypothetical protein
MELVVEGLQALAKFAVFLPQRRSLGECGLDFSRTQTRTF